MSILISSNMNLPIPGVGTENSPTYAFDINSCLTLIDQHDHSPGKGIKIQPNGLNISSDLDFLNHQAINLSAVEFISGASATSTLQALSVAPGASENDLWYTDSNGVKVQITNGGTLNAVPTTVSGITYTAGTFVFTQTPDSLTNPAALDAGSVTIRPNVALTTFGVTLSPPSAIASQYPIVLPLLPPAQSFTTLDNLGNLTATIPVANGITRSMLAPGAVGSSTVLNLTSNGVAVNTDDAIFMNATGGNRSITLYSAIANGGRILNMKKTDSSTHTVTIATVGGQTIDGASTTTLNTLNESIEIMSDGSNWQILDRKTTTTPIAFTPVVTGWASISASRVFSWREGAYLCVQGSFTGVTPNGTASSMSLAFNGSALPGASPSYLIDTTQTGGGSPVNTAVGWYASDLSTNGRGAVIATASTSTISFGDNGQHSTSALIAEPGNVITVSGNTMTFFFKVPIVGWNG